MAKTGQRRGFGRGPGHGEVSLEKVKDTKRTVKRLLKFFGREKILLLLSLILLGISVALNASAPARLGGAITNYLERSVDIPAFATEMFILLAIYVGAFFANMAGLMIVNVIANRIIFRMREEAFHNVQRLSVAYFDKMGVGDVISRLTNDLETVYSFMSNGFMSTLNGIFSLISVIIAMFLLDVSMTLVLLLIIPIVGVIMMVIGGIVRKDAAENQEKVGDISKVIEESVSGIKVIQSFNRVHEEEKKFNAVNETTRAAGIKMETSSYMMMPAMLAMNGIAIVLMIGFGGLMAISNPAVYSIGLVSAFILYARQFMEPFQRISNVYNLFNSALAGAERVFEVFDSEEEIPQVDEPFTPDSVEGTVEFKSVSFGYVPEKPVLSDISLKVDPGQMTAIVGPTGAGKTTIINLLTRFYDIQEGEILIDGKNIKEFGLQNLRSQMGIVLQEPFFFASTIRENLLYGRPDATEKEIIEAAKTANAHHFISCLPDGYDTMLTERGMNLSQGERQLLGITRTILSNPKILILDEATSNIDSLTEKHIQNALITLMKGRTSFIIAHRLSTIKKAHKVLVIHNHTIIEEGTHRELMAADGFYKKLYSMQFVRPDVYEDDTLLV